MIIPMPLPDELCRGHIGRLRKINGFRDYASIVAYLHTPEGGDRANQEQSSVVDAMARICKLDVGEYVRLHTMIPFLALVSPASENCGTSWKSSTLRYLGAATPRSASFFCQDCVNLDLQERTYSYWRRVHQLPGIDRCPTHQSQLMFVEGWDAFNQPPCHWLNNRVASTRPVIGNPNCPFVARFQQAALTILQSQKPCDASALARVLASRLRVKYPNQSGRREALRLTELSKTLIDESWLAEVFPSWNTQRKHCRFDPINVALLTCHRASAESYCLAISILFDSADDAFQAPSVPKLPRHTHSIGIYPQYFRHDGQIDSIAEERQNSRKDLRNHLIRKRMRVVKHKDGVKALQALRRFERGEDLREAAATEGVSMELLQNILRLFVSDVSDSRTAGKRSPPKTEETASSTTVCRAGEAVASTALPASGSRASSGKRSTETTKQGQIVTSP